MLSGNDVYPWLLHINILSDSRLEPKSMAKAKRTVGSKTLKGICEIKRGEHGRVAQIPAVADVRAKTGLSQSQFALLMGVSVRTLQEWEQGRRAPSGAARTLILIAAKNPASLAEVAWRAILRT